MSRKKVGSNKLGLDSIINASAEWPKFRGAENLRTSGETVENSLELAESPSGSINEPIRWHPPKPQVARSKVHIREMIAMREYELGLIL